MVKFRGDRIMTKNEQVEQMAKERNEIKDIMKLLDRCGSLNPMCKADVATIVYGNNYRKVPENAVVITKDELKRHQKQAVKEFSEKLKECAQTNLDHFTGFQKVILTEQIDELLKEYEKWTEVKDAYQIGQLNESKKV